MVRIGLGDCLGDWGRRERSGCDDRRILRTRGRRRRSQEQGQEAGWGSDDRGRTARALGGVQGSTLDRAGLRRGGAGPCEGPEGNALPARRGGGAEEAEGTGVLGVVRLEGGVVRGPGVAGLTARRVCVSMLPVAPRMVGRPGEGQPEGDEAAEEPAHHGSAEGEHEGEIGTEYGALGNQGVDLTWSWADRAGTAPLRLRPEWDPAPAGASSLRGGRAGRPAGADRRADPGGTGQNEKVTPNTRLRPGRFTPLPWMR